MKKFAIFGNPVAHSKSPRMHNLAFQNLSYGAFYGRVLLDDPLLLVQKFNSLGLSGANITVPFKETTLNLCDEIDDDAKNIGAINTIIKQDNKIIAYNTDALGFMLSIKEFGKIKNALIIGAGGTAKALSYILNKNKIKVDILNRSDKRANFFKDFDFYTPQIFTTKKYDLVINTTPAGLINNDLPIDTDILNDIFSGAKFAFDVVYGKQTPFLNLAKSHKLHTKDGKEMLLYQGILAFDIFTQHKFNTTEIENSMRLALNLE